MMEAKWAELEARCRHCDQCPLCENRHNVVIGDGNRNARILLVGEGPGEQEDLQGIPFVGPAGQLLDEMLSIIDLDRSNYYITNIVKCRPPKNRDPLPEEQIRCIGFLQEQMALIQPKVIICLGRIAAQKLIHQEYKITREHGQWEEIAGTWRTAIYHPSALLRDPSKRPETFDDLLSIRAKLRELGLAGK